MKKIKWYITIIFIVSSFIVISCSGLTEPGSTATTVTTPYPTSPLDNARDISLTPTFEWNGVAEKLQISISYDFSTVKYEFDVSGSQSHTIDSGKLTNNTLYFWRVGKTYSNQMSWSGSLKFITIP